MVALTVVGCCLGAVAFAAIRRDSIEAPGTTAQGTQRPLRPLLTDYPIAMTTSHAAEFSFRQPARPTARRQTGKPLTFECRLDRGEWESCESPIEFEALAIGMHRIEVRARNANERTSPVASREWRVIRPRNVGTPAEPLPLSPVAGPAPVEPPSEGVPVPPEENEEPSEEEEVEPTPPEGKPFSIEPELSNFGPLYPGEPAELLPVTLINPNSEPILVTDLQVAVSAAPEGCDPDENFEEIAAGATPATPVTIPAEASVTLPAQGVEPPALAMRELPVSQDACQGAELPLTFTGEAHG